MARYLLGLGLLSIAVLPVVMAARAWRRRLLPIHDRSTAVLADAVLSLAALVVLTEVVGTLHQLRLAPVTILFAIAGAAAWWLERSRPPREAASVGGGEGSAELDAGWSPPSVQGGTPVVIMAVGAVAVLAAAWVTRTVDAYHHGMSNTDTLWYHMPFAARFAQTGSITGLHYVDSNPVIPFYPANSELFHALGIVFMRNDVLSPVLNLGWLSLALLAAWCAGRRFGVGWLSVMGAAVLLDTPGMVATQPGGAYTDTVGLALLLASIAVLIVGDGCPLPLRRYVLVIAALAAGLSFGTKFTLVAPVGLLTVGVVSVARRGRRLAEGGLWIALVALSGGYWYVRNLVTIGNPLPSWGGIGPIHLPNPRTSLPSSTVAHYLFNGAAWSRFYLPGLRSSLGPAWWAILGIAAAGMVGLIVSGRNSTHRMLGFVSVGCVLAFLVTPQFLGNKTQPLFFVYNLRYASPGILMALVLLPLVPVLATQARMAALAGVLILVLGVTQLDPTLWPTHVFSKPFSSPTSVGESLLGAAIGFGLVIGATLVWLFRSRYSANQPRRIVIGVSVFAVVALLLAGYPLQRFYLANRYTNSPPAPSPTIDAWAQHIENARIAFVGMFSILQYPYYGRNADNFVQFLYRTGAAGGFYPYPTCSSWRRALYLGRYDYVIVSTVPEFPWTATDPSAREVLREQFPSGFAFIVYRLAPHLDLRSCSSGEHAAN